MRFVAKYISISKALQKSQIFSLVKTKTVWLWIYHLVCANMMRSCWLFSSGSFTKERMWDPLFRNEFHVVDGTSTVFDLLQRKCDSSSHIYTSSVHFTLTDIITTKKKLLAQNPNALATCCAFEYICVLL